MEQNRLTLLELNSCSLQTKFIITIIIITQFGLAKKRIKIFSGAKNAYFLHVSTRKEA